MKSLTLFVFLAVLATGYALKCYVCTGNDDSCSKDTLEGDKDKYSQTCMDGMDKCMRMWAKHDETTAVINSCSNQAGCDAGEKGCESPEEGECKVGCCDSDECNASSTVSFSVILMAACSVFGLALMK